MQPLANITLKMAKVGSSVQRLNVTPAEVLVLVNIHRVNAGGDPIVRLKEIPPEREDEQMAPLQKKLDKLVELRDGLDDLDDITPEVRTRRENSYRDQIEALNGQLNTLKMIKHLRTLTPTQERDRLKGRYQQVTIKALFPGAIPQVPQTFEEARKGGLDSERAEGRFMVGPEQLVTAQA